MSLGSLVFMNLGNSAFVVVIIIGAYLLMGFLISAIVGSFMNVELEKYVFATLLFWPLVLVIGAIFQLIRFIKNAFKGEY